MAAEEEEAAAVPLRRPKRRRRKRKKRKWTSEVEWICSEAKEEMRTTKFLTK